MVSNNFIVEYPAHDELKIEFVRGAPLPRLAVLRVVRSESEESKAEARWLERMSRTHRPPQEWYEDQANPFES